MNRKVLLILADGMRADALEACGNPFVGEFLRGSATPCARVRSCRR